MQKNSSSFLKIVGLILINLSFLSCDAMQSARTTYKKQLTIQGTLPTGERVIIASLSGSGKPVCYVTSPSSSLEQGFSAQEDLREYHGEQANIWIARLQEVLQSK